MRALRALKPLFLAFSSFCRSASSSRFMSGTTDATVGINLRDSGQIGCMFCAKLSAPFRCAHSSDN